MKDLSQNEQTSNVETPAAVTSTWFLHGASFLFVAVTSGTALSLFSRPLVTMIMLIGLGIAFLTSTLFHSSETWLRVVVYIATCLLAAACALYYVKLQPPPIKAIEYGLAGIIITQGLGTVRPRHYALMCICAVLLFTVSVQHAGAETTSVILPVLISGILFLVVLNGTVRSDARPAFNGGRRIPLHAVAIRITLLAVVTFAGGQLLFERLPVIGAASNQNVLKDWITYFLGSFTSVQRRPEASSTRPRTIQNFSPLSISGNYANNAVLDLSDTHPDLLTKKVVFNVKSPTPCYLRGLAFDHYNGNGWSFAKDYPLDPLVGKPSRPIISLPDAPKGGTEKILTAVIWVRSTGSRILYHPVNTQMLKQSPFNFLHADPLGNVFSPQERQKGIHYKCLFRTEAHTNLATTQSANTKHPEESPEIRKRYTQLPNIPPKLMRQCTAIVNKTDSRLRAVQQLKRFIKSDKTYTLESQEIPKDREAVNYFLSEMHAGSCSHFASALAVTCRIAGIPARVVTGYAPGTYNPSSRMYVVREKDSHAWTQVWFPDIGWVNFDPSPGGIDTQTTPEREERSSAFAVFAKARETIIRWKDRALENIRKLTSWLQNKWHRLGYLPGILLALFMIRWLISRLGDWAKWHIRWTLSKFRKPRQASREAYCCCLDHLRRKGLLDVNETDTPSEFAYAVSMKGYRWSQHFENVTQMATRLMFAEREPTDGEKQELRRRITALLRKTKKNVP